MTVIDMKGKLMEEPKPKEPTEQDVAFMFAQAEQIFKGLRTIANTRPALMRNVRLEFNGRTYGISAFMRLIDSHTDLIKLSVQERRS